MEISGKIVGGRFKGLSGTIEIEHADLINQMWNQGYKWVPIFPAPSEPKEEKCQHGHRVKAEGQGLPMVCVDCGKVILEEPSQPRPEIPKKILLGWLDCRSGENNDLYLAKIINQLISCVEELRKDK